MVSSSGLKGRDSEDLRSHYEKSGVLAILKSDFWQAYAVKSDFRQRFAFRAMLLTLVFLRCNEAFSPLGGKVMLSIPARFWLQRHESH